MCLVNIDHVSSNVKKWFKVDQKFVTNLSSASYMSVESMWSEIYAKMISMSDPCHGDILSKIPWDTSKLVPRERKKIRRG